MAQDLAKYTTWETFPQIQHTKF